MTSNQLRPRRNSRVAVSPPANLTSGGTIVPTTVPHSGRESSKRAAPLCEDGSLAPRRTTATSPWTTGPSRLGKPGPGLQDRSGYRLHDPFVALPARESWPYLCASAVLGAGYMVFLNWAYRVGDLSHVYPFARGIAPLIVAIVSTALLGEQISEAGKIAVILIALGIASLALTRGAAGLREPRPIYLSFIAGGFVGAYTITDALGARSAGSPNGYMVWVTLLYAILVAGCFRLLQRGTRPSIAAHTRRIGAVAGLMS